MNIPFDLEELVATKDVAKRTGTTPRFWDGFRCKGGGPRFIKLSTKCIRYRWGDVVEWLKSRNRMSTSDNGAA